ncbi:ATPase [Psychrobacter frigidicola]|uniref:ATPase n=1 Tax=Psychrobacter frigidicola TaxID=45611 RepID=A0A5C7A6V9_9GAMM|nr:ATPase [Psychrobacter frigidicola]TXD97536.1 ATPase [Psychrobacter frigidicola]
MSKNKPDNKKADSLAKEKEPLQTVSAQFSEEVINQRLTPNPLSQFSMDKDALRLALVTAQFALRATRKQAPPTIDKPTGLLVLVNGMEQAGKGTAVTQLRQWVDPRLLKVEATIGYPSLMHQPIWQAHIKAMPRHGDVMVYFGNWYADLLYNVMRMATTKVPIDNKSEKNTKVKSKSSKNNAYQNNNFKNKQPDSNLPIAKWQNYLHEQLIELQTFEHDLAVNHTKILKCWFHIDAETLQARLNDDEADPQFLYQIDWSDAEVLAQFNQVAATLLSQQGDWVIIDGCNKSQAATDFCHEVLQAMQAALASSSVPAKDILDGDANDDISNIDKKCDKKSSTATDNIDVVNNSFINTSLYHDSAPFVPVEIPKLLIDIDNPDMVKSVYHEQLAAKQAQLAELLRARGSRHVVFAFEGMDAAGKGGAIKRVVAPLDPREYQIYNIGAPMLYELQHPYLWRFWTRLPNEQIDRISRIAIFDRTWYGRVLVERIENLTTGDEWQRAYAEINRFEEDLVSTGTIVLKYWLAIDKKEQLERFDDRQDTPHKQFKLTDDDWRNRDKWGDYVQAAADMLARTDTTAAPWCVVATNNKHYARLQVLDHAIIQLENRL